MKEVYILSGLGADERVFKSIDFSQQKVTFIKWIVPDPDESIKNYSKRLTVQIHSSRPILIGLSFGGMMAIEIAKHLEVERIILISSSKTKTEIPFYFRWIGILQIHRLIPASLLKKSNFLTNWFFGAADEDESKILKNILRETDTTFLKWAIDKIVNWKNNTVPQNLIHIHGTADRVLPLTNCDFKIEGGGHLMILSKANEISNLLQRIL